MPLSAKTIENLDRSARSRKFFDGGGLYIEIPPNGQKRWRLKYRFEGREKRISLGVYPDTGLAAARKRRDEARHLLAEGIDPSQHRQDRKRTVIEQSANTFEVVAREWFEMKKPGWAESHSVRVIALLENDFFEDVGAMPVAKIDAPLLLRQLRKIEKRTADTAHRAKTITDRVFAYAVSTGRMSHNPSTHLKGVLTPIKKAHFAATLEPKRLGEILRMMDSYTGMPSTMAALKLAPMFFVRPGELRTAEWAKIDLDKAQWEFTSSKTQTPLIVPLSTQAVAILRELHKITGDGTFVFPGNGNGKRPISDGTLLGALRRMKIGTEEMCMHGLRAVARTILDETLGFRDEYIEQQLAHRVRGPLGAAYNRSKHLAERRKMMQAWSDHLDLLKAAEVVAGVRRIA